MTFDLVDYCHCQSSEYTGVVIVMHQPFVITFANGERVCLGWQFFCLQDYSIKKLSCRREASRCFMSLNISLTHSRSLKVIRNDTLTYGMYKCLRVFHCNYASISCYASISYYFWDTKHQIMVWPWILGCRSFKVIENVTIRKFGYGFLFAFHSNYGRI